MAVVGLADIFTTSLHFFGQLTLLSGVLFLAMYLYGRKQAHHGPSAHWSWR